MTILYEKLGNYLYAIAIDTIIQQMCILVYVLFLNTEFV